MIRFVFAEINKIEKYTVVEEEVFDKDIE